MIKQTLTVVPHGLIESGQVILNTDQATGLIDASESLIVGISFFTQTKAGSQEFKIPPELLLSKNLIPGTKLAVGQVTVAIEAAGNAIVSYIDGADHLNGTATLDLSGEYAEILHINLTGTVDGEDIQLELISS